jgi:hypothetical protein
MYGHSVLTWVCLSLFAVITEKLYGLSQRERQLASRSFYYNTMLYYVVACGLTIVKSR